MPPSLIYFLFSLIYVWLWLFAFFVCPFYTIPGNVPYGTSRSYSDTPHSVELPWTSDQPDAKTSTWQHTTLTTDWHPCLRRNSNPQSQQASDRKPTPQTARPPGSELYSTSSLMCVPEIFIFPGSDVEGLQSLTSHFGDLEFKVIVVRVSLAVDNVACIFPEHFFFLPTNCFSTAGCHMLVI